MKLTYRILIAVILLIIPITSYASSNGDTIVHITSTGSKYHTSGCGYLRSDIAITLEDAVSRGYSPCSRCNPPVLVHNTEYEDTDYTHIHVYKDISSDSLSESTNEPTEMHASNQTVEHSNEQEPKTDVKSHVEDNTKKYTDYFIYIGIFFLGYFVSSYRHSKIKPDGNENDDKKLKRNASIRSKSSKNKANIVREQANPNMKVSEKQNDSHSLNCYEDMVETSTYIHYFDLYAFYKPEYFVNIPKGVYFRDGIPIAPGKGTYGLYTVYTTKNGNKYHHNKDCIQSTNIEKTHIMYVKYKRPCSKCVKKKIPDIEWYNEYNRIRNIKRSYYIP